MLEAERVTLTLELEARQTSGPAGTPMTSFFVSESSRSSPTPNSNGSLPHSQGSPGKHTLTIEFRAARSASQQTRQIGESHPLMSASTSHSGLAQINQDDLTLLATLSAVLGAPGFDSSARATLLREVLQGLPEKQTSELIDSLKQPPGTPIGEDIRQACHLVRGILFSGPTKSVSKGTEIFEQIFARYPMQSILGCLETTWKSQDDWM